MERFSGEVCRVMEPKIGPNPLSIPAPDVLTFQREARVFDGVAGYQETKMDLTGQGAPARIGAHTGTGARVIRRSWKCARTG